ncbi:MAG: hypothetical protein ACRBCK_10135 [Alphaproteobacteria bacterium]
MSNEFKSAVVAGTVLPFLLLEAYFDTEVLRFWSGIGHITVDGNVYTGSGNLLSLSDITETQKIEAQGIAIELNGIPNSMISVAENEDYQGRDVKVKFAALDNFGVVVADPITIFSGKADVMEITDARDKCKIKMTVESDMIALFRSNERRRTPEDQKRTYPNDTFFDSVAGLQSKQVIWGG